MTVPLPKPATLESECEAVVQFVHTENLPDLLRKERISLLVSTYQAQRTLLLSAQSSRLSMLMRVFPRPTGIALDRARLALYSQYQVIMFENKALPGKAFGEELHYDRYYAPHSSRITGDIAGHELAWVDDELIIINTLYSCLCRLDPQWSFVPLWKPSFISDLVPEDRCHLNGMAIENGEIQYLTALGMSDIVDGWRAMKQSGGCVIDFQSGEVLARGLSMPHSPRMHDGKLWVLESGLGALIIVDPYTGKKEEVARFPGYTRGLAFHKNLAFIGLSQIRDKKTFGGLPLESMHPELECGVQIFDTQSMTTIGFIKLTKGVEELFDLKILTDCLNPFMVGFEESTINSVFTLPTH